MAHSVARRCKPLMESDSGDGLGPATKTLTPPVADTCRRAACFVSSVRGWNMASPVAIQCNKTNPIYGSLLTLAAAGFSPEKSVKFGQKNELEVEGLTLENDARIALFIAQASTEKAQKMLLGEDVVQRGEVFELLADLTKFLDAADAKILKKIEDKTAGLLEKNGSLFAGRLSVADFVLWSIIADKPEMQAKAPFAKFFESIKDDAKFSATHQVVGRFEVASTSKQTNKAKKADEGKFIELPGAEVGKVVVRFPPEASGYLHIGHAKAALLNQYYQKAFQGKLIMRFDDTNPAKEDAHFEDVIKQDLELLHIVPDLWTHSSDHFDTMLDLCEQLLKQGKAFVDDTDVETMRTEREERKESVNRSNSPEKNLEMWEEMKKGSERGQKCCVRIKMDMKSNNGAMRDPTIYRCKNEPHVRTGDKYKVYPTYDFACPIVDSTEGVTHALRTTEYMDRDDQYYFICDALGLRKPYIWAYSRLNMTNTVMSKRKLTWFVDEKHVSGWDDPRLPTVRGVMRRGLTVDGLKEFIRAQGGSRSVVMMEWDKIWAFNKKVIDPVAPRYTALDGSAKKLVHVLVNDQGSNELSTVNLHPKDPSVGTKSVWFTKNVWIEAADAATIKEGDIVTFINWGNLKIAKIINDGEDIKQIVADLDLDNKDYKKTLKTTWIATSDAKESQPIDVRVAEYDHIISKAIIAKDEDWKQHINFNSLKKTDLQGEPAMKNLKKSDIIQIQRKGYFIVDKAYAAGGSLELIAIPDGSRDSSAVPAPQNGKVKKEKSAKVTSAPAAASSEASALGAEIQKQGELVRQLKGKDAKSQATKDAIAKLLELKKQYKEKFGAEFKPQPPSKAAPAPAAASGNEEAAFSAEIQKQGELVRELKGKDAKSQATKDAIAKLLELKKQYKAKFGAEYKPQAAAPASPASSGSEEAAFGAEITKQGELVREAKAKDAKSQESKDAIAKLLELKKQYKAKFGAEYKPQAAAPVSPASPASSGSEEAAFGAEITKQGEIVREAKAKDAKSQESKDAIAKLLDLKKKYKEKFGAEFGPAAAAPSKKGKKK
ncbi:hypothetical protein L596_010242 [Steinernema carpocapsae]|uniref:glutamate--tRNA ligase n=1 Tax=Steinernema carpocapsae TaxID=34508 RepID=A0A4U5PIA7_STECR|nr:hypothetical protein L596_010242 [Steinernema carpocapsae]